MGFINQLITEGGITLYIPKDQVSAVTLEQVNARDPVKHPKPEALPVVRSCLTNNIQQWMENL